MTVLSTGSHCSPNADLFELQHVTVDNVKVTEVYTDFKVTGNNGKNGQLRVWVNRLWPKEFIDNNSSKFDDQVIFNYVTSFADTIIDIEMVFQLYGLKYTYCILPVSSCG